VLDLMMPRIDGFEVLQKVRAQPRLKNLPIVIVTAKELSDEDRQRLTDGAQGVILKQAMRLEHLLDELRDTLAEQRVTPGRGKTAGRTA